ncbi:NAD(P)-binding protein [Ramicandelaber brevisporus]|nr:NAD(P)-binding protein [Ramicandelaber brevisporus]
MFVQSGCDTGLCFPSATCVLVLTIIHHSSDHDFEMTPVVVVTGGTRGIGHAIASSFAANGANVVVLGRRDPQRVATNLPRLSHLASQQHLGLACDMNSSDDIMRASKDIRQWIKDLQSSSSSSSPGATISGVSCLVNNAGISSEALLQSVSDEHILQVMQTNLIGSIQMTRNLFKDLVRAARTSKTPQEVDRLHIPGSCVINISSVLGTSVGSRGSSIYSASKAGLLGFTKSLAAEGAPFGIRANAIAPGYVATDMTAGMMANDSTAASLMETIPLRRFGEPSDIADTALFLAKSRYITGELVTVDGGLSL